ncbi:hypothetical protein [Secundilactobacillus kimchicus]|uniref:Uncharacterized protein n=1 Tax=Secundilactobacillus kimchicus JCM 15530 TaxID=1302272 RepID=A0A0R1HP89_9LACO|nr:hypothetical protein [Secundilactobacillus kimchicus]KRK48332.1 hypothetical protein FC96_GL001432 [Secundilactobacillus kimchicus JCM 15530]MBT9671098.1 hypothetical protein [Secundilactobacillus kimchicus]
MTQSIQVFGQFQAELTLPDQFKLIASDSRTRNHETVTVERYQMTEPVVMNGPHVTVVYGDDGRLISYNNFAERSTTEMPSKREAVAIAKRLFQKLDPQYARDLSYMRVDQLSRSFVDDANRQVAIPIMWVKFAHANGSYNWVSVGAGGQVIEMERESEWDYWQSRRATEEWNYDDWVLARMGLAPQPAAPEALA